jgi:hypothetical protein
MDGRQLKTLLPGVPLIESPFFDEIAAASDFDPETRRIASDLHEKGYAVLQFPDDDINERAERIKAELTSRYDFETWRREGWARNEGLRILDAWKYNKDVRAIACNEKITEILSNVFGRRAWPFQSLNFPVGSQQHFHSDSVHFSSIPEKFMCGVWLALEDVHPDSGPLIYYPGTHKWPILYNDQIGIRVAGAGPRRSQDLYEDVWRSLVDKFKIVPEMFFAKKGQALIWLANLLHGGSRQQDPSRTRWSQVTHYYFDDCCYITPMLSDVLIGKLFVRDMTDIKTGRQMPNRYVGANLSDIPSLSDPEALPQDFDPKNYLRLNPDVAAAGADATQHYMRHGLREGRRYK